MTSVWFSPAPSEMTISRISLDFELRSADLFFRELVVPEVGRVWFVRQISWAVSALALYEDLRSSRSRPPKPTAICHGIEALACKLEYTPDRDNRSRRILGTRAFARDPDSEIWMFERLRHAANYVRNTHRQAATRAIREVREDRTNREGGGLGFARGPRFDLLELEPIGRDLANAFLEQSVGKGGTSLRKWLLGWVGGDQKRDGDAAHRMDTLVKALSPEHATDDERAFVRSRLFETSTDGSEKRKRLATAVGRAGSLPDIEGVVVERLRDAGYREQAHEIVSARAFGAMLDRSRDAVANLTRAVEPGRGGVKLATLARDSALRKSIRDLRTAAKNYLAKAATADIKEVTSRSFADAVLASDDPEAIQLLVRRAGEVLALADGSVLRGALFRVVDATDETNDLEDGAERIEPDRTGRTFRIANLHSLLRDADQRVSR